MTTRPPPNRRQAAPLRFVLAAGTAAACLVLALVLAQVLLAPGRPEAARPRFPREVSSGGRLTVWWDTLPAGVRARAVPSGGGSNTLPADYVGPEACKGCHKRNYESWARHPHHWMNALATPATVKGDFSGTAAIAYRGGRATFRRAAGKYLMRLQRGAVRRTYEVTQTIGSRFYQYYAGKQVEGPEPKTHHFYRRDHLLPFGYWLAEKEWVPVVHIGPEVPDARRPDPFAPPDRGPYYADYAAGCNACHTTFPLADLFARRTAQVGAHAPLALHWSLRGYLEDAHPDLLPALSDELNQLVPVASAEEFGAAGARNHPGGCEAMAGWEASRYAVTLGVSCEACHLGGREHAASGGRVPPRFFPASPHLFVEGRAAPDPGRTHDNVNWACGRCHTGGRPRFAAGMSTWNSVEYTDALRGSCYSKLRCADCHNPHRATGTRWSRTAAQDDTLCLKCHDNLRPAAQRQRHTHHPAGSEGARCMNCHMPRINEGLQDVVRTHMIYSPTRADMIEAGHPNACNLCHTDRPIGWTLRYLKEWYGAAPDARRVAAAYPDSAAPVAVGWLKSDNPAVRLVAGAALTRAGDFKALPPLLEALDDEYLVNRQFAAQGLQGMLGVRLADLGYHFYMTAEERRRPLADLRARYAHAGPKGP
jgi:predicted CXXCH cytochrome family protein